MTVDREDNDGVRLHVGGLTRGADPKDLEALFARALPAGTKPRAEIMRDATTGIERGFGYVSVPGGEGVGAAARRAIVAYNGTRWKGNRIKVSIAKGDYMQRLKKEWEEAATAAAAAAANRKGTVLRKGRGEEEDIVSRNTEGVGVAAAGGAAGSAGHAAYKARPLLRLRRRPGERIILVDPTPIPWLKPQRPLTGWQKEREKKQAAAAAGGEEGDGKGAGQGEGGEGRMPEPHRRKRGVLGCRRRVVFPGREETCSTKCRDLWRRHLQERAAEASAARLRSVERLISGKESSAAVAANDDDDDEPKKARKRERRASKNLRAAELLPVEDSTEAGLASEEPPSAGIEFVWDDADAGEQQELSGSDAFPEEEAQENAGNGWRKQELLEEEEDDEAEAEEEEEEEEDEEEEEEEEEEEAEEEEEEEERSSHLQDGRRLDGEGGAGEQYSTPTLVMPVVAKELGKSKAVAVAPAPAATAERKAARRLRRLGDKHGLELDDRLAELLSDGSDDEDDGGYGYDDNGDATGGWNGYDYELETARRAEAAGGGKAKEAVVAAGGGAKETPEGMRDRLQAETERSLGVLAAMFGGSGGSGSGATRTASLVEGKQPPTAGKREEELKEEKEEEKGGRGEEERQEEKRAGQAGEERQEEAGKGKEGDGDGGIVAADQRRFMAHIPKLTDIFKVQDKVSTKKNKQEKDKDKSFKVASLFGGGGVAPVETGAGAGLGAAPAGGGFSFSFGGDDGGGGGDGDGGGGGGIVSRGGRDISDTAAAAAATVAGPTAASATASAGATAATAAGDGAAATAAGDAVVVAASLAGQESGGGGSDASHETGTTLWRPLGEVVAVGARFMRVGTREDVEAAWLGDRRALTQDFKRKHKDAVKGRRGGSGRGGGGRVSKRRRA